MEKKKLLPDVLNFVSFRKNNNWWNTYGCMFNNYIKKIQFKYFKVGKYNNILNIIIIYNILKLGLSQFIINLIYFYKY